VLLLLLLLAAFAAAVPLECVDTMVFPSTQLFHHSSSRNRSLLFQKEMHNAVQSDAKRETALFPD